MCLKIVLIFVLFPEMVAWKTTGDGHKEMLVWSDMVVVGKFSNCLSGQTQRRG